jgi:hypothetical protein
VNRARVPGMSAGRPQRLDALIPPGSIVYVADLDDPAPEALHAAGIDVVLLLHGRDELTDGPILLEPIWRPGLVPGRAAPSAFWVRRIGNGFIRVDEGVAA